MNQRKGDIKMFRVWFRHLWVLKLKKLKKWKRKMQLTPMI